MEKGSMVILAIIATLILSLIMVAGLTVSTTEVNTTQNFLMNKISYYKAVEGVEIITEEIRNTADPATIYIAADEYEVTETGVTRKFITGTLENLQNLEKGSGPTYQNVKLFMGFDPPPLPSISLGTSTGVSPVIWYVPIASEVTVNRKRSFTEIEAGIYSILLTGY
ncbi:MAG TPA: hypothetical protein VMZ49_01725 [Patescibacteria group bacterium]|nr:hypothetical protein [Patescibacteria group bacterium]